MWALPIYSRFIRDALGWATAVGRTNGDSATAGKGVAAVYLLLI